MDQEGRNLVEKIELEFEVDKETAGTVRFDEKSVVPVVGKLYVKKSTLEKMGWPQKLKVTIEIVDD